MKSRSIVCLLALALACAAAVQASAAPPSPGCSARVVFGRSAASTDRAALVSRVRRDGSVVAARLVSPAELRIAFAERYPPIGKNMKTNPFAWELQVRLRVGAPPSRWAARYRALAPAGVTRVDVPGRSALCLLR